MEEIRIFSPTAILGYGYPNSSLEEAMRRKPHVIAVDGGSTDGGPYYLGMQLGEGGGGGGFIEMLSRDVGPLLRAAMDADIPLIIGSAGFAGAELHLQGTVMVIRNLAEEMGLHFKMAVIHAEIEKEYVKAKLRAGKVEPLGPAPALNEDEVDASVRIVGQMGVEPFVKALEAGAQVIVAGRSNDPSMFAALPFIRNYDKGLSLHLAKILECAAIAAEPGSGSDSMMGVLRRDHFLVEPTSPERRCTVTSVAAHSLYEKSDPLRLYGPGGTVNLSAVKFEQHDERTVKVTGSRYEPVPYKIKLEGSKKIGYRTVCIAGVRDPGTIQKIDVLIGETRRRVAEQFSEHKDSYRLMFHVYGRDGVMEDLEPVRAAAHELGLVIEAIGPTQSIASGVCAYAHTIMLHHGFPGRISTAGNLAFPFSPLDIPAGPVYEFNVYHLVEEDDPCRLFPMDIVEV
ncbi:MAG: acyclic terpene utilization AtuA family protein [Candidatus Abyssobacteria bacterium SURF_5]|uniref:Acyclic terpene utilization AtuA family protein n=1 Tax=Abyssobacteria bacterium (strain SURF_5) TaxID=2093360 RepID=A0A3A4NTP5_ABYX5|nr:MAG: acyclic terpene utilization AtuA family protein [Candidatus Abyssubacteria bacterium SURF_5]